MNRALLSCPGTSAGARIICQAGRGVLLSLLLITQQDSHLMCIRCALYGRLRELDQCRTYCLHLDSTRLQQISAISSANQDANSEPHEHQLCQRRASVRAERHA
ncbi:hypothetical protein QQF64_002680 [Cirrhinus molitorella]|uniref:Uncharacterized protein n=1 Tax=Cirrhinus molitorella TaxID=172907 RepID=A0ABR3MQX4_9TELE